MIFKPDTLFSPAVCALTHGLDPQVVLLDLDGTLIDSVPDLASSVDHMLVALERPPVGRKRVAEWIGNGADMLVRRALCDGDETQAVALLVQDVQAARQHFDAAYLAALHQATGAFAGVGEFLQRVSIPKIVITNKPRMFTEPLIESLGWSDYFPFLICGDDYAEKKPSPMPLIKACEKLSIPLDCALMIGDSRHDIQAAKAAGIATAAVTYGYNHGEDIRTSSPDLICDNLLELLSAS